MTIVIAFHYRKRDIEFEKIQSHWGAIRKITSLNFIDSKKTAMKKVFSKKVKRRLCLFLSFLSLFYTTACSYFKVHTTGPGGLANIGELHKHFVIHNQADNNIWGQALWLTDLELTKTHLSGNLEATTVDTVFQDVVIGHNRVKREKVVKPRTPHYQQGRPYHFKQDENSILNEVHIYVTIPELAVGPTMIPLDSIQEVRIIEMDSGKAILSFIGVTIGIFVLLLVIVALTKSSCPYIYTYDGEGFIFQGEIYGGAIQRNLERHDFMPLPLLRPVDGEYRLRLSNELKERQYTNLAELVVVNHPEDSKVLLDSRGRPHLISKPIPPEQALSDEGLDLSSVLQATDRSAFLFNEVEANEHAVHLSFPKPKDAQSGRLLLNAKNTLWLDYIFGEFTQKFGAYYNTWVENQAQMPAGERWQQAIEQEFPLSIYLNTKNGWELVEHLPTVGPLAARDFVIPIDLSQVQGDQVELRLQTGFFFWEADYTAMDFTAPQALDIRRLQATLAIDQDEVDHRTELASDDDRYFAQPKPGLVAELRYPAIPAPDGQAQSVFLHSKGYYEHVRDYGGAPDFSELRKFREPGHFSDFSMAEYLLQLGGKEELLVIKE